MELGIWNKKFRIEKPDELELKFKSKFARLT